MRDGSRGVQCASEVCDVLIEETRGVEVVDWGWLAKLRPQGRVQALARCCPVGEALTGCLQAGRGKGGRR